MKLLYVGDNRDRLNWGCRATSIALRQLLDSSFSVLDVIYGKEVAAYSCTPTHINTLLPVGISSFAYRYKHRSNLLKGYLKFEQIFFAQTDYISEDINISVKNFLHYQKQFSHLSKIYKAIESCDALVFNGEGDMIFTTPARRNHLFFLTIIEVASQLGKNIFYLNSMISACPVGGINQKVLEQSIKTLSKSDYVSVRDLKSLNLLKEFGLNTKFSYVPDALFTWLHYFDELEKVSIKNGDFLIPFPEKESYFGQVDLSNPYICVGGSSLAAGNPKQAVPRYIELVESLKNLGINIILVQGCAGDNFLHEVSTHTMTPIVPVETPILLAATVLANSKLFISGRYHPSIMASLGGTPCIFLGSNSHKNVALQEILEYDSAEEFSAYPSSDECNKILKKAQVILEEAEEKRTKIKTVVSKLSQEARKVVEIISL
jgi:polysaccharide pyruvyl transferase WcaK-like protein